MVTYRLMRNYEFADPQIGRAVYHSDTPLEDRTMLLEARCYGLRSHLGVRVGGVTDTVTGRRPTGAVWGWDYRTDPPGAPGDGTDGLPGVEVARHRDGRVRMHALALDGVGGRRGHPTGDLPEPTLESVVVERAASGTRLNQAFHRHR